MSLQTIHESQFPPINVTDLDECFKPNIEWHRTQIHLAPQHGCALCPPTPCACGWRDSLCPNYFEHRRDYAGAETTWREAARG